VVSQGRIVFFTLFYFNIFREKRTATTIIIN
jgi:hypothetical protein